MPRGLAPPERNGPAPTLSAMSRWNARPPPSRSPRGWTRTQVRPVHLGRFLAQFVADAADVLRRRLGDEGRAAALLNRLLGHHALGHVAPRGQLELDVEQGLLED